MLPKFPLGVESSNSLKYSQLLLPSTRLNRSLIKDPFLKLEKNTNISIEIRKKIFSLLTTTVPYNPHRSDEPEHVPPPF